MENTINVAIIYSPNWLEYIKIEVFALTNTQSLPLNIYLISDAAGRPDDDFCEKYNIKFIDLEQMYDDVIGVEVNNRFSKYTLYRLLIPRVIPNSKLLYLDADAIVNSDLVDLYNMDMGDNLIAGVPDCGAGDDQYNLKAPLGLSEDDIYINAGVLLFDLDKMREENIGEKWVSEIKGRRFNCFDQDIINMTCKGRIKTVELVYNVSLSTGLDIPEDQIKIRHFAGGIDAKPWANNKVLHHSIWEYWTDRYTKESPKIPKKIHYCWFGGREKPAIIQKCMDSWRKYLPDYEIIEWNENNFDLNAYPYAKIAYDSGKYAFVTDVVRLWALYQFGGIYLDGDVEILQPLDRFLKHRSFTGHEIDDLWLTAVMGAEPRHPWIEMLLKYYETAKFDCIPNTQTVTRLSKPFLERAVYDFKYLKDGVVIYPADTFAPFNHQELIATPTENSYAIHHFAGTWLGRVKV